MKAINIIADYMHQFQNVIRFDLTTDRLYSSFGSFSPEVQAIIAQGHIIANQFYFGYNTYNTASYLDLIKSDSRSSYHLSLWGAMWRRDLLKRFIISGETAQQIELSGTNRLAQVGDEVLVLGTRQSPLNHANVIQGGVWNQDSRVGLPALIETDREELKGLGCI